MLRRIFLSLALGLGASCVQAQTAPSPADVGISKGTPDTFKLKGHDNAWTPFGSIDPSTHVFVPGTNGAIAPNDCVKWGPGLTSAGAACNSVTGGAHPANQLTIYTNHAGLLANVTTPTEAWTVQQQGFYAPGDGGDAIYQWDAASLCPGGPAGTPTRPADGLICILPIGQSAATPGRYTLSFPSGSLNVRQFGLQPGLGTAFDNSPYVNPMLAAIAGVGLGPSGPDIIFPPTLGQIYTSYYFSEPFENSHGTSLRCSMSGGDTAAGSRVWLNFPAGVPGVSQEIFTLAASGSADTTSTIVGCSIGALGHFGTSGAVTGSTSITQVSGFVPPAWTGAAPLLAPGDGIMVIGGQPIEGAPLVVPGAYVGAVSGGVGNQTITLASPYVLGQQQTVAGNVTTGANIWRLPANEKYQVTTTAGSHDAVITGGRRPLKAGTWIWSEAFVFGSMLDVVNNVMTGTPTVNAGGSGYVGASGTMTWAGSGCTTAPVLNVTASGGAITAVTGVANAGVCNGAWPSSSATTWTPGGGLSAGSGAAFNVAFQNNARVTTIIGYFAPSPALPGKTGTYNLWGLSAGLTRHVGARTLGARVEHFPIGLEMFCDGSSGLNTGCATSLDQGSSFSNALVGRYVVGSDSSPSTAIGNEYDGNAVVDIVEAGSLPSVYINENANSPENDYATYGVLGLCDALNFSVFIGGYLSSGEHTDGFCLGQDVNGNGNIGVKPKPYDINLQGSMLSLAANIGGTATVNAGGQMLGRWRFGGYNNKTLATTHATPSGNVVAIDNLPSFMFAGMGITDVTTPAAIPANTTVTSINLSGVTISNPVAGGGVLVNDKLTFSIASTSIGGCFWVDGGIDLKLLISPTCDGTGLSMGYNGYTNAFQLSNFLWLSTPSYLGYNNGFDQTPIAPVGIVLGSPDEYTIGHERMLDNAVSSVFSDTHLEGDARINKQPSPGGNLAWAFTSVFATTLSANVVKGTTTSVAVAACPSPALPAGTPIDSANSNERQHVGNLASCVGTTLTFQAAALANATSGWGLQFMQSRQAGHIANDAGGTSWPVATMVNASSLAPCTGAAIGFGVVYDGEAYGTKGYGTAVAGGGGVHRPIFCDGTSWTYH